MYNDEKTIWINQQIYIYKDKVYNSNGSLELVEASSTQQELKYFSPATIQIKVSVEKDFSTTKNCTLNISKLMDLNYSIKEVLDKYPNGSLYSNNIKIVKRYNNDRDLNIAFKESRNTKEKCVVITIVFNESNFTTVIIPLNEFMVFVKLLKDFENTYIERTKELKYQCLMNEQIFLLKQLNVNIQTLPSLISPQAVQTFQTPFNNQSIEPSINELDSFIPTNIEELKENINNEFDSFLGKDLVNVEIPKLEKDETKAGLETPRSKREIESNLIDNILKNDISVIEDILNSAYSNNNPIESLSKTLYGETKDILPGINEDDYKSITHISNLIFKSILRNYLDNNISIPNSVPTLKYKINNIESSYTEEKQLAIDLLMIHAYLKTYRTRIESKSEDVVKIKSIMYLAFRNFIDPFCFSMLELIPSSTITSSILEKFDFYKSKGFFKKFDDILIEHKLTEVEKNDIISFLNNVIRIIETNKNSMYIGELNSRYIKNGEIKLPTKNNLTIEQIINEVVKIDVAKKMKPNESYESITSKLFNNPSVAIKSIYFDKEETKSRTNLSRMISNNISEIPDEVKNKITEFVTTLGEDNFNYKEFNFNLRDLGENVLKALYLWKPKDDSLLKTNFIYYTDKIKNLTVDKNDVINLLMNTKESVEKSAWDDVKFD